MRIPNDEYIEARLAEWCEWLQWRDYMLEPRHLTVEQWILESNRSQWRSPRRSAFIRSLFAKGDKRVRTPDGPITIQRTHISETRTAGGDGGMVAMVSRMERARAFDRRGREIDRAVRDLDPVYAGVLNAMYRGPVKVAPRSERAASIKADIPRRTYQRLYPIALAELYAALFPKKIAA